MRIDISITKCDNGLFSLVVDIDDFHFSGDYDLYALENEEKLRNWAYYLVTKSPLFTIDHNIELVYNKLVAAFKCANESQIKCYLCNSYKSESQFVGLPKIKCCKECL